MANYPSAPMTQAKQDALVDQWCTDVGRFPPQVLFDACAEWRRNKEKRPTPSQIIALCENIQYRAAGSPARDVEPPSRPFFDHAKFSPFDNPNVIREGWRQFPIQELTRAEARLRHEESKADCASRGTKLLVDAAVGYVNEKALAALPAGTPKPIRTHLERWPTLAGLSPVQRTVEQVDAP